jgi:type II secretory pathway component PulM
VKSLADSTAGRWWQRLTAREQIAVGLGAAIVIVAAAWTIVWQPLVRDWVRTEAAHQEKAAMLVLARQRVDELSALPREGKPVPALDPKAAALRVLDQRGLRAAATAIDAQEARVRITFASLPIAALAPLLEALGREQRLFPVEVTLTARVEPATVRAEITLAR